LLHHMPSKKTIGNGIKHHLLPLQCVFHLQGGGTGNFWLDPLAVTVMLHCRAMCFIDVSSSPNQTSSLAKTFAGLCLLVFALRAHVFALFLLSGWMFLLCFWSAAPCFWAEKQLKKEKLTDVLRS